MRKDALGSYCPRCGKDVSGDIIRCSNCGTTISFNQNRNSILTKSGTIAIVGACIFLFAGAISFFLNFAIRLTYTLTNDLVWLGILSLLSFALGLIGGVLALEMIQFKWTFRILLGSISAPIVVLIVDVARYPGRFDIYGIGILGYFVELTFLILDLPAICLMIAALALAYVSRKDFVDS